jgi:hypothetical protein
MGHWQPRAETAKEVLRTARAGYLTHPPVIQSGNSPIMMIQATHYWSPEAGGPSGGIGIDCANP